MRRNARRIATLAVVVTLGASPARPQTAAPVKPDTPPAATVWMGPPGVDGGRALRELFEHPDQWAETRPLVDVLFDTDLHFQHQYSDAELRTWLPQLKSWRIKLALEVGAIKEWGQTGAKTFSIEQPMWDRIQSLGGQIYAVALDEPLVCTRHSLKKPDDYAVQETAAYIALVRQHYPQVQIGDIEPYPSIPLADHMKWIEALQGRLTALGVRGLDFYRLDVDWVEFNVKRHGSWQEVRDLQAACRQRKLPFSLIYWAADYPAMQRRHLADDSTWYVSIMRQGYDYAAIGGTPDQYVIESWVGAPARCVPDTADFTFTRSVRDFVRKFVHPPQ